MKLLTIKNQAEKLASDNIELVDFYSWINDFLEEASHVGKKENSKTYTGLSKTETDEFVEVTMPDNYVQVVSVSIYDGERWQKIVHLSSGDDQMIDAKALPDNMRIERRHVYSIYDDKMRIKTFISPGTDITVKVDYYDEFTPYDVDNVAENDIDSELPIPRRYHRAAPYYIAEQYFYNVEEFDQAAKMQSNYNRVLFQYENDAQRRHSGNTNSKVLMKRKYR